MFHFKRISIEEFKASAPTDKKTDFFTGKFISHCRTGGDRFNDNIIACTDSSEEIMGAAVITVTKNKPHVGNLQLLQTFSNHSGQGVATILLDHAIGDAHTRGARYLRSSFEPTAVSYYTTHGWKVHGIQKSGYYMSMCKLPNGRFTDAIWTRDDVINRAVNSGAMGSCVEVFDEATNDLEIIFKNKVK